RYLETYNSLTDKHLVGYFSNARIRRHLQKSGLVSRSGRIIPEKEYRLNAMRKEHQRHVLQSLADAISHKILDMERHHQREIKRRLESSMRKDRRQPLERGNETITVSGSVPQRCQFLSFQEQVRGSVEKVRVHCPHPPRTPRCHHELCPLAAGERVGRSPW
ncbi:ERIC3 protein, partial [Hippolais icterina]|nr:ERIC3 protein [Hippolais icterina]